MGTGCLGTEAVSVNGGARQRLPCYPLIGALSHLVPEYGQRPRKQLGVRPALQVGDARQVQRLKPRPACEEERGERVAGVGVGGEEDKSKEAERFQAGPGAGGQHGRVQHAACIRPMELERGEVGRDAACAEG